MKRLIYTLLLAMPFAANGQDITTFAGTGSYVDSGDGGAAAMAGLGNTIDIAFGKDRNLYILSGNKIRKISPEGTISMLATTIGGSFNQWAIGTDDTGNVYYSSSDKVYRVSPAGVTTHIAGGGSGTASEMPATAMYLEVPAGICSDAAGNIYISQQYQCRVNKVSPSGIATIIAGTGWCGGASADGGPATAAALNQPMGIVADKDGNIYIVESGTNKVRKVSPSGIISTVAGNGSAGHTASGVPATATGLASLRSIALDASGNIYISSFNMIRKIATDGIISTVAGSYFIDSFSGDGGPAAAALLDNVGGLATDKCGNLYIEDRGNHRLRKVLYDPGCSPVSVPETPAQVYDFSLFPNPAADEVTITGPVSITHLVICDILGAKVLERGYNAPTVTVDVASLPVGVYLVTINNSEVRKFLKQ